MNWQWQATEPLDGREDKAADLPHHTCQLFRALCRSLIVIVCGLTSAAQMPPATQQQNAAQASARSVTAPEIVQQLVAQNAARAEQLRYYVSRRHYHLEYRGFPSSMEATLEAEITYDAPAKTYRVLSESGSHTLINHVLLRLLASEQQAADAEHESALTPENYRFTLLGTTIESGRQLYILQVDPKSPRKFLYRGKIWVDGEDYAVVRIEAQPAENPSFWIRDTQIRHIYEKQGRNWLPKQNVSITKVRMGGTATLTIDYENYNYVRAVDSALQPSPATAQ
jgi:hypothetical protein